MSASHVVAAGAPLERASYAVILAHGRGGSPEDMLGLAERLALPDVAWLAPEAPGRSWWPTSFLAPLERLEPALSTALETLGAVHAGIRDAGIRPERTFVLGFSQGACLALEYGARSGQVRGGIVALSGGLVGTADLDEAPREALYGHAGKAFDYDATLDGVPVFIGCHERDPHIPLERVRESERAFAILGADVSVEIHPGAGHGVVEGELRHVRGLLNRPRADERNRP